MQGVLRLTNLSHLTVLGAGNNGLTGFDFTGSTSLESINLTNNGDLQGDVAGLATLTNLIELSLVNNTQVSGDVAGLAPLADLTTLDLDNTQVSGDVVGLAPLANLTALNLDNTRVSGDVAGLDPLTDLIWLDLGNTQVSGDVAGLAPLTDLTTLSLDNTLVSGDVAGLAPLTDLTRLYLSNTQVSGDLAGLAPLTDLTTLYLDNTQVSGKLADLAAMANLTEIGLLGNSGIGGGLADLAPLDLYSLYLNNPAITGSYDDLSGHGNLWSLYLSGMDLAGELSALNGLGGLSNLMLPDMKLRTLGGLNLPNKLSTLDLDGNHLPLSQLALARAMSANYRLGSQTGVLWGNRVLATGAAIDLSGETGFDGQATTFTAIAADGQAAPGAVTVEGGLIRFNRPGNYYLLMENPALSSQGIVNILDPATGHFVLTDVTGQLAQAISGWLEITERHDVYSDLYGGYNRNNAHLAAALERATAAGWAGGGELDKLLSAAGGSGQVFNQATGEILAQGHYGLLTAAARPFMDNVAGRYMDAPQGRSAWSAGEGESPWRLYFAPLGSWGHKSGSGRIQGYDLTRYGAFLSLDRRWDDFRLGAAFSFTNTELDYDRHGSETEADSVALAFYARRDFGPWFVGGQAGLGRASVDNRRNIPALGLRADSDYGLTWYQAELAAGYTFEFGQSAVLRPSLGLAYLGSHSGSFTEHGAGNLNLKVSGEDVDSFEARAQVDVQTSLVTSGGLEIIPRLKLGAAYEMADRNAGLQTRFNAIPAIGNFEAESSDAGRWRFMGGAGLGVAVNERLSLALDYETSLQSDYQYHQGSVSLKLAF